MWSSNCLENGYPVDFKWNCSWAQASKLFLLFEWQLESPLSFFLIVLQEIYRFKDAKTGLLCLIISIKVKADTLSPASWNEMNVFHGETIQRLTGLLKLVFFLHQFDKKLFRPSVLNEFPMPPKRHSECSKSYLTSVTCMITLK